MKQDFQVAEIEISYKTPFDPAQLRQISGAANAYELFAEIWDKGKINLVEQMKAFYLNKSNRVLAMQTVSTGGMTGTVADPRSIFVAALKCGAVNILLAHNHPSGNLNPSMADLELTKKIKEAGKMLDITLLDHLIITTGGYYSFADSGDI
jgi:DNA repair protein RadC